MSAATNNRSSCSAICDLARNLLCAHAPCVLPPDGRDGRYQRHAYCDRNRSVYHCPQSCCSGSSRARSLGLCSTHRVQSLRRRRVARHLVCGGLRSNWLVANRASSEAACSITCQSCTSRKECPMSHTSDIGYGLIYYVIEIAFGVWLLLGARGARKSVLVGASARSRVAMAPNSLVSGRLAGWRATRRPLGAG